MGTLNQISKMLNWGKNAPVMPSNRYGGLIDFNSPVLKSEFGRDILISDIVKTAIHRIAEALSKCVLKSVVEKHDPHVIVPVNDEINALFAGKVNPFMTLKDFLYKTAFITIANENCFIYPAYNEIQLENSQSVRREYTAFYPLDGVVKGVIYHNGTEARIELSNLHGYTFDMPYDDIIHIRRNYGQHPFLGGDSGGRLNTHSLLKNLQVIHTVKEAIPKTLEASLSIKGVLTMKGMAEFDAKEMAKQEFENHIQSSRYGLLSTDYGTDFHPVNIQATDIPENIMKFVQQEILYPFGVSMAIMEGKYNDAEYAAFYETAIEGLLMSITQAFTATVFTKNQRTRGHKIKAYDRLVQNMSMETRLKIVELFREPGTLSADEQRELAGFEPNGKPTRVSLNYVDEAIINAYQLNVNSASATTENSNGGVANE